MLNFIIKVAIAIWLTSSLFMTFFYVNTVLSFRREGKDFAMPLGAFLYFNYCPIVHTIKCVKILKKIERLKRERGM